MNAGNQENILKRSEDTSGFTYNVITLPLFLSVFILIFLGSYFESNDDLVMSMLLSGALQSNGGAYDLSYFFYRYLVYAFEFLYSIVPVLPWYGISLLLFNIAATANIFYILVIALSRYFRKSIVTFLLFLFFFTVIAENVIEINFTRISILLGGSSTIVLFILLNGRKGLAEWLWIIACSLFVICSVLIRPMAGLLVSSLLLPFILYSGYKLKSLKYSVYFTIIMGFVVTLLFISTQKFRPQDELIIRDYASKVINIIDFNYESPHSVLDYRDSLKKESIQNFFVSDREVLTDDYLERISSDNYLAYDKITLSRFKDSIRHTFYYLFKEYPGMTLLYISVFLAILIRSAKDPFKVILIFVLLQVFYFSSIVLIHTIMKLPERLFVPLYGILVVCLFFAIFVMPHEDRLKRKIFNALPYLFIISLVVSLFTVYNNYKEINEENRLNTAVFNDIRESYVNKSLVLTTPSSILLGGLSPLKGLQIGNNRIFPFIGWTTFMPSYYRELKMLCGSEEINDFMSFVKGNPEYIFISNEYFNDFVSRYFLEFYENEIVFQEDPRTPQSLKNRDLKIYNVIAKTYKSQTR